jgi:hypothetical protein
MLYEEDHFHPTNSDVTLEDVKSIKVNNKSKIIQNVKGFDSSYIVKNIEIMKQTKKGHMKRQIEKVEMYGSGDIGTHIRNAVSGQRTPHLVGSKNEDLYFSVIEATGINGRSEGVRLFYDSPEQYENHFHITLDQNIKQRWHNKFLNFNKQ